MLENYLRQRRAEQELLLMTHIVLGYPSFDDSLRLVEGMVEAGVDLIELQIPFSEPMADGPVIVKANQRALAAGATVDRCLEVAAELAARVPVPLLFMTYYNILHARGVERFAQEAKGAGLQGAIVPDLPPEEGKVYLKAMKQAQLAPIFIFSPTTTEERMKYIGACAEGFVYCVARKGVTGAQTHFSDELQEYLARCRQATSLPLAVGFGVKNRADVDFLRGKADIAVVGSATITAVEERGVAAAFDFIRGLL